MFYNLADIYDSCAEIGNFIGKNSCTPFWGKDINETAVAIPSFSLYFKFISLVVLILNSEIRVVKISIETFLSCSVSISFGEKI